MDALYEVVTNPYAIVLLGVLIALLLIWISTFGQPSEEAVQKYKDSLKKIEPTIIPESWVKKQTSI